jgi:hypothetical protein
VTTGFHRDDWQLWVSPEKLDKAVYLRDGDTIERWSYVADFVGCM